MRVSVEDLDVARDWLLVNEGDEGEAESCRRVAEWIAAEIEARQIRSVARECGVSMRVARKAVATNQEPDEHPAPAPNQPTEAPK